MVEGVIHLPPQREFLLCFPDREVLEQGDVVIVESGPDELSVVAVIAEIATSAGSLERRSIKSSIDVPLAFRKHGASCLDNAGAANLAAGVPVLKLDADTVSVRGPQIGAKQMLPPRFVQARGTSHSGRGVKANIPQNRQRFDRA